MIQKILTKRQTIEFIEINNLHVSQLNKVSMMLQQNLLQHLVYTFISRSHHTVFQSPLKTIYNCLVCKIVCICLKAKKNIKRTFTSIMRRSTHLYINNYI